MDRISIAQKSLDWVESKIVQVRSDLGAAVLKRAIGAGEHRKVSIEFKEPEFAVLLDDLDRLKYLRQLVSDDLVPDAITEEQAQL